MTLSAAPLASITVSRRKPGPSGSTNSVRRSARAVAGTPLTSTVSGPTPPETLSARRIGLAVDGRELEPRVVRREHDAQRRRLLSPATAPRAEVLQRRRQLRVRGNSAPLRRARQRRRLLAGAREGVEQDRRRGRAADQARHRRAVGPADPDADGAPAVEAHRPRIAIAVGGAGLVGDAAAGGVFRRRRADQHVADIPGRDRIEQPARRGRLAHRRCAR